MPRRRDWQRFVARLFALGLAGTLATPVSAQPSLPADTDERWVLSFDAGAIAPLTAPQRDHFRPGLVGGAAIRRSLHPKLLLGLRFQAGLLFDGPAPADETLADPGIGTFSQLHLAARIRPLGDPHTPSRQRGLFVDLEGGGTVTGGDVRLSGGAAVGWGLPVGAFSVAPVVRYTWIWQPAGNLDTGDAHLLSVGVEIGLLEPSAAEAPEVGDAAPPPSDRDGDGLLDDRDGCPDEPEDADAFEDEDGCPDPDNDRDGIADDRDDCPLVPEDFDQYEDDDGCPEPDNDLDGFPDERDGCPNDPEVINGVDDGDGCPDEGLIAMVNDRIVLEERVLFDFERARVKSRARPVLEAIAELVRQHPEWTRLRIEGHADVRGDAAFNQSLSERRARNTLQALVRAGVNAEIIDFVGYGSSRPRDRRRTEGAHQRNRRVEFVVLQRRELTDDELEERERQGAAIIYTEAPEAEGEEESE